MSTVKIIRKDEKLVHQLGETKFFYKRISSERAGFIRRKHTKRGEMDASAAGFEMLDTHLLGWENVQDWDGNEVEFSVENIRAIPDEVLADLITMISSSEGTLAGNLEDAVKQPEKTSKNS
jgi:hypothetical protein